MSVRVIYGFASVLALAACIALLAPRAGAGSAISGLPTAPTVSYAIAPTPPHISLRAALASISLDVVTGSGEWFVPKQSAAESGQTAGANATIDARRYEVRLDTRHARYVLLSDTSPVFPIGPTTALPSLSRQPVWLVPVEPAHAPLVPGQHVYLVFDAQTGWLFERLVVETVDALAACRAGLPGVLGTGWLLCLLIHGPDAPATAYRSVA